MTTTDLTRHEKEQSSVLRRKFSGKKPCLRIAEKR